MGSSALEGVKVLEFATMVSGPYCAKLLGDLGANVIKVETGDGDPARDYGQSNDEDSALFLYLNTSKRGVRLDLASDVDEFRRLIRWADVLVDNHDPETLAALGLGWQALRELNPSLVYTSITPYGRTGPRANQTGDELTLIHAAGLGNLLPTRSVDVSRAPVKMGGNPVGYHGGVAAATATLAALLDRQKTGQGHLVDISLQEVMVAMIAPTLASARYHKSTWSRVPDRPPAMGRMQTQDGYVVLNAFDDHHFAGFRDVMGNPDWCSGEEWDSMAYRAHHLMDVSPRIDEWMSKQTKDDVHHKIAGKGVPIGPMNTAADVMDYPQYKARGYFTEVQHPKAGAYRYAGTPYKMSASPAKVHRPAPALGEHNAQIIGKLKSNDASAPKPNLSGERRLPLQGIRVLEFAWVWAGPYASMLLAQLGAEVIKVESNKRPDLMRRAVIWPLPEQAPEMVSLNQGISFNSVNMNKKGITLDLTKPEGVEIALKLAAKSNIVIDNMRPGALGKLGLGYEGLCKVRPDIIAASSSGRGSEGPESQYLGYAMIHHAIGGASYITGYPEDHPCHTTGDVDIMNATTVAFAILAAVHHHARTGEGQFIDYSQCEGVSSLIGEVLLRYEMTSEVPERKGNEHHTHAPHDVYRAWGVDRWVAIEVHSDKEFASLTHVMGRADLATDPRFADAASRKNNEDELNPIIEEWTRARDRDWIANALQDAHVTAAPSRDARDLYADPHLRERGAFVTVDHPELGALELVGPPWKIEDLKVNPAHAPLLGQDNDYVMKEILGLSDDEFLALQERGVIA